MPTSLNDPQQDAQEIYNIKSENQTGGITAGKIQNFNIFTDKDSLGIRDPMGLYKKSKKIGSVINPVINEKDMIFTFDEIKLNQPIPNSDVGFIFSTFEFQKYIVQATKVDEVVAMMPPGAKGVKGKILSIK